MTHDSEQRSAQEYERADRLKQDFRNIFVGMSIDSADIDSLYQKIIEAYRDTERAYHTLEHVESLLSFLRNAKADIKDWTVVQLAAWFHDSVYDTKASDNEEQSAQLARSELEQLSMADEIIRHVEQFIRATAKHQVIEGDEDSAIFLDGDLAILGASDEAYDRYAAKIRQEYSWVPDEQYKAGRKRILEGFLSRPRIYYTESAHSTLDSQARENLQREIKQLG